jgi:hypothetical protein
MTRNHRAAWVLVATGMCAALCACGDDDLSTIITEVSEVHYQGGGAVDLLFVVDSSGSMGEEQEALGRGAGAFVGRPTVLTPDTPDLIETFQNNALVGLDGSGTEKGLEAARQALGDAKLETVNEGFWRQGAVLSIIFVSDEDDYSTADVDEYFDFFLDRKLGDRRRLKISAIAGPVPDGCDSAEAGTRYKELVDMTGGSYRDICSEDLGMAELGEVLSGYKPRFSLAHAPLDGEVVVSVNGEAVDPGPDTWSLNEDNEVAFVPDAVPDDCAEIQIAYWTGEAVNTGGEPIVVESEAPLCANFGSEPLSLPPRSCAQVDAGPPAALLALLFLFGIGRGRIRER